MKPSDRILQIIKTKPVSGYNENQRTDNLITAITDYLDEEWEKKQSE